MGGESGTAAFDVPASPETRGALGRYQERARGLVIGGVFALLVAAWQLTHRWDTAWAPVVAPAFLLLGLAAGAVGLRSLSLARRMGRALAWGSWSAHPAVLVPLGPFTTGAVLTDPVSGEARPLLVRALPWRRRLARPGTGGELWWCGGPAGGGVLTAQRGGGLLWAESVRDGGTRDRLAARAGAPGRDVPEPRSTEPRTTEAGPLGPVRAPRRKGRWRWVALVGVLALGFAFLCAESAKEDPRVDVTVLGRGPGDSCTVAWTDPSDGSHKTGPFRCAPAPKPEPEWSLWPEPPEERPQTGYVVSYGPWEGELYNAEREGTSAFRDAEAIRVLGVVALLAGLAGGAAGLLTRRRRAGRGAVED
ncbi:hypothetical protein ACFY7C_27365 [Streptomyces sp. NPDC012769]|uniref:hypothetical protein n=1 Tax=Streptomyces sp. NPDC012769 TaxID=3364848 RepID=UPI00367C3D5E